MGESRQLTIAASMAARAVSVGVGNALPPEPLLEEARIDPGMLEQLDGRVPVESFARLWQGLARRLPEKVLALEWLAAFKPGDLGVLGYVLGQLANVGQALDAAARYHHLVNEDAMLSVERSPAVTRMVASLGPSLLATQHVPETLVVTWVAMIRRFTGAPFVPLVVELPHPRTERTPALEKFLSRPVEHGRSRIAVDLPTALLDHPIQGADPALAGYLRQQADQMLARADAARSFTHETALRIADRLPTGEPGQATIAKQMAVSERTLQRRLQDEGTTFNRLLAEARRTLAIGYLTNRKLPAYEVSFLLGYAEPATFFRAFKRWTGQTPQQYRASVA
jgi:AraC-like DNA-binding protein